jgi:hypothetical protein
MNLSKIANFFEVKRREAADCSGYCARVGGGDTRRRIGLS